MSTVVTIHCGNFDCKATTGCINPEPWESEETIAYEAGWISSGPYLVCSTECARTLSTTRVLPEIVTSVDIVAQVYGRSVADVERWPAGVVAAFHRNAVRRGWLVAS